ncbi:MAG: OsmC family protein [Bacteroidales bacterium]|nr:OsmC family protein [Bacteroidales bacterium]
MPTEHHYQATTIWTGNKGTGTNSYSAYERSYQLIIQGKPAISGSSDPTFRGDNTKHNPEELLVSALSSCHMLWYLHLCAEAGVIVTEYTDTASGTMVETTDGGGHFTVVTLHPVVTVAEQPMIEKANALHKKANELCFVANSVNFPVKHHPVAKT